jgi:hypothetical protein
VLESPPAKKQKICAAASPMPITTEQKAIAFTRREAPPSSKRPSATPRGSGEGLSRRPRRPLQRGRGPLRWLGGMSTSAGSRWPLRNQLAGQYKGIPLQLANGPTHLARVTPNPRVFPTPMGIFSLLNREESKTGECYTSDCNKPRAST